ncbi:hypothetical protein ACIOWK_13070 [Pseudomonas protegens]|uniref:hypothetical protein n=1 Tax=Pseudomonas protegens TaxID=380021 RepID=UPI0037F32E05
MYVGFELNRYERLTEPYQFEIEEFRQQAKGRYDGLSEYLIGVFEKKDVIDAQKIAEHIFPDQEVDVFLSHSHGDEGKAIELAVSLQAKGLKVFVDSCVWRHFHELLDDLNQNYAEPVVDGKRKIYSYRKATDMAAGVHMMLNGALHKMIDRSELFIFLDTEQSIPLEDYENYDRTFSPWIYSELEFSSRVRCTIPKRRLTPSNESVSGFEHLIKSSAPAKEDALLAYKAFNRHLPKVTGNEFQNWYDQHSIPSENLTPAEIALDALYDTLALEGRFEDLKARVEEEDQARREQQALPSAG